MFVALAALVFGVAGFPEATAQRPPVTQDRATGSDLIALSCEAEGRQQVTVIDPKSRVIAVYHVDRATGALSLKSVRNVHWDLLIEDFNSANPTPREIRALTEKR
jgi:hypothetical protein